MNGRINTAISVFVAFLSTNIYWLLTVSYIPEVKKIGEPGMLVGFQAVEKLFSLYGFSIYLRGMSSYFITILLVCILTFYIVRNIQKRHLSILSASACALISSIIYYLFTATVYMYDAISDTNIVLSGLDALSEQGIVNIAIGIIGVFVLIGITVLVDLGIKSTVNKKILKQNAVDTNS